MGCALSPGRFASFWLETLVCALCSALLSLGEVSVLHSPLDLLIMTRVSFCQLRGHDSTP